MICTQNTTAEDGDAASFAVGTRVRHGKWGDGQVSSIEGNTLVILFGSEGEKKLALDLVREEGLLHVMEPAAAVRPYEAVDALAVGAAVVHETFGEGEVQRVARESVTVLFEREGYKTLAAEAVDEGGLVKQAEAEVETASPAE